MAPAGWVLVGRVMGAHGIKGEVKVMALTADPMALGGLGPLHQGPDGPARGVLALRPAKAGLIMRLSGIAGRNDAEALRGASLYVPRERLGAAGPDEMFAADLIGLRVCGPDGAVLGMVTGVVNYGASDLLEIEDDSGRQRMAPFTRQAVPMVDMAAGVLHVDPAYLT